MHKNKIDIDGVNDHMQDVVSEDMKTNPKRFFTYVKSRKQEAEGVSPLMNKNGFLHSDSSKKADILNEQFQSEYTLEQTSSMPSKGPSPPPAMPRIKIGVNGVTKLLRDLKPHKAAGPDSLPMYILKVAPEELAPVLTKIFQISLDTGGIPDDWREAHIIPLFKKGDKHLASNYCLSLLHQ